MRVGDVFRIRALADPAPRLGNHPPRRGLAHAGELVDEKLPKGPAGSAAQHMNEPAELDAVGMRLDLLRQRRKHVDVALEADLFTRRIAIDQRHMRIGDGGLLQIDLDRVRPFLIVALHLHFNSGSVGAVPRRASLSVDIGLVPDRIDRNMKFGGELVSLDAAEDMERLGEGELRIHARSRNSHALLAARLAQFVEFRPVEELAEYARDLGLEDPRPVVLDHDPALAVALAHLHSDFRQDRRLLAGIERIVDGLLDRHDQGLGGRIEAEQMPVLEKELRDGNVALPSSHIECSGSFQWRVRHGAILTVNAMVQITREP